MTINDVINKQYLDWLSCIAFPDEAKRQRYSSLLHILFDTNFVPIMCMDKNRISDGLALRKDFAEQSQLNIENMNPAFLNRTRRCNLLELMVALCIRMEREIMADLVHEDRTSHWFNEMIYSLNVYDQIDESFNEQTVVNQLNIFINREYEKNGFGSLFTIEDPTIDMRELDIWMQMNHFLNEYDLRERRLL